MKFTFTPPPKVIEINKTIEKVEMPQVGKNRQGKASFITAIPVKKSPYEQNADEIEMKHERSKLNGLKIAEGNIAYLDNYLGKEEFRKESHVYKRENKIVDT